MLFDIVFLTLHINFLPSDSLFKNKADNKCHLKFGTEGVKSGLFDDDSGLNFSSSP